MNLAEVLQRQDQFEEAKEFYQQALSGREEILGTEHPNTLVSIWGLALHFRQRRQYQNASQLCLRAGEGFKKTLDPDHLFTLKCDEDCSEIIEQMRRNSEAENTRVFGDDS